MLAIKDSVRTAIAFVHELYPEAKDIRLEEVAPHELENAQLWDVVVSFTTGEPTTISTVMGGAPRLYKNVRIDADGQPLSLTVWNLEERE